MLLRPQWPQWELRLTSEIVNCGFSEWIWWEKSHWISLRDLLLMQPMARYVIWNKDLTLSTISKINWPFETCSSAAALRRRNSSFIQTLSIHIFIWLYSGVFWPVWEAVLFCLPHLQPEKSKYIHTPRRYSSAFWKEIYSKIIKLII